MMERGPEEPDVATMEEPETEVSVFACVRRGDRGR